MIESVKVIEQMLRDNAFDKSVLINILDSMSFTPIVLVMLPAGNKILRSSTNNEHKFHKSVSRLNYPPVENAKTERTSLEKEPMFYGTVFTSAAKTENGYPRIFSAFETTDILRDYNLKGKVIMTQSVWVTQDDIFTFAFPYPYPKDMPRACDEIKSIREMWDAKLVVIDKNVGESFLTIVADSRLDADGVLQWTPNQYALSLFKNVYGFKDVVAVDDGIVGIR